MTDTMPQQSASIEENLPEVLMRIVTELYDVAYLIERVEPQLLEVGGPAILQSPDSMKSCRHRPGRAKNTGPCRIHRHDYCNDSGQLDVDVSTALNLVKLADMHKALSKGHAPRPFATALQGCGRLRLLLTLIFCNAPSFELSSAERNARASFAG